VTLQATKPDLAELTNAAHADVDALWTATKAKRDPVAVRLRTVATLVMSTMKFMAKGTDFRVAKFTEIDARLAALEARENHSLSLADSWKGVWALGEYKRGEVVSYDGSLWLALALTDERPGDGKTAWRMIVKRGKNAR
jgi:hypothetical protein